MANITMVRIDERLVHGQIIMKWIEEKGVDKIIIIDDDAATNPVMQKIFRITLPQSIGINIYNLNEGINFLTTDEQDTDIILLVRDLLVVKEIYRRGVEIKDINIGRIPADVGRKRIYENVYLSHKDKDALEYFKGEGISTFIQVVPDSEPIDVYSLKI